MVIHFICRGNAFRSIIAEAYLNSLQIPGIEVMSSGTVANRYKQENLPRVPKIWALLERHGIAKYVKDHIADDLTQDYLDKSDIVVCLNGIAYDEATSRYTLPNKTYVWDVTDIGEKGRVVTNEAQRERYMEDVYDEIVKNMEELRLAAHF